jgi:hypothetical protein
MNFLHGFFGGGRGDVLRRYRRILQNAAVAAQYIATSTTEKTVKKIHISPLSIPVRSMHCL